MWVESAVGSGLLKSIHGSIHGLASGGEGTGSQHFDLLRMADLRSGVDYFLSSFGEFLSEVSELQHLAFDKGIS